MRKFPLLVLFASILTGLVACVPVESDNASASPEPTLPPATEPDIAAPTPTGTAGTPEDAAPTPELERGEVPQGFFDAVLTDLMTNQGVQRESIHVIRSEAIIWNDGSIGCAEPGVMYTQALVNGYQVIFGSGDATFDYHLSDSGYFVLCEFSRPATNPQGTPEK